MNNDCIWPQISKTNLSYKFTLTTIVASMLLVGCGELSNSTNQIVTSKTDAPQMPNTESNKKTSVVSSEESDSTAKSDKKQSTPSVAPQMPNIESNKKTPVVSSEKSDSTTKSDKKQSTPSDVPANDAPIKSDKKQSTPSVAPKNTDKPKDTNKPVNHVIKKPLIDNKPKISATESQKNRIEQALRTGNASFLQKQDISALTTQAIKLPKSQLARQQAILASILNDDKNQPLDQTLNIANNAVAYGSIPINTHDVMNNIPLAQSDSGLTMSALSIAHNGRGLMYGRDVLGDIVNENKHPAHRAILANALRWVTSGNAKTNPTAVKIASVHYDAKKAQKFYQTHMNATADIVNCDVFASNNDCWKSVDVIFLGDNAATRPNATQRISEFMRAGKGVVYMASGWWSNRPEDGLKANTLAQGMGLSVDAGNGNYWASGDQLQIKTHRTLEQSLSKADRLSGIVDVLTALNDSNPTTDSTLNANHPWIRTINQTSRYLQIMNEAGKSPFESQDIETLKIWRYLVLLADMYRPSVVYDKVKPTDTATFLTMYVADSWLDYTRQHITALPKGAGDYMPAEATTIPVSQDWETITVTIPQTSGVTLIGRASIPSQPLSIQVVPNTANQDNANAKLRVQTSYLRAMGNPFEGYQRPRRPQSHSLPINDQNESVLNSPFGGPLILNYNNATAGSTITLRIKGSAKYAHYDFTQPITDAQINEATTALQSRKFGWNTFKFTGGDIQQITPYALKSMGNDPRKYVDDIKTFVFESNHIANGYNNITIAPTTKQYCNTLGWDCTGTVHNAPNVQHFIGWIAQCGWLCSGNPTDAFTGVDTGWGWVHELGHNTVQRVLTLSFKSSENGQQIGCMVECDNNHLAGLSMLRKYQLSGGDYNTDNFAHWLIYRQLQQARATGKTGKELRLATEKAIWNGDGYANNGGKRAFAMQQAFAYSRLHLKQAQPDLHGVFEYFKLLNIGNRLVDKLDLTKATAEQKAKYGVGAYNQNNISNIDLNYILTSKIIGHDMKDVYEVYGLPISEQAHRSVAMLNLPIAPVNFYAIAKNRTNHLNEGRWIDKLPVTGALPSYPFPTN